MRLLRGLCCGLSDRRHHGKRAALEKKGEIEFRVSHHSARNFLIEINEENINSIPAISGVYQLFNVNRETIYIRGVENVRTDLEEKLKSVEKARFFRYEEHDMYSIRENELLAKFLKKHGALPEINNEISDLY